MDTMCSCPDCVSAEHVFVFVPFFGLNECSCSVNSVRSPPCAYGLALTEALEDTIVLRRHIATFAGEEPTMAVLEGHSMGGLAAALLAERHPELSERLIAIWQIL